MVPRSTEPASPRLTVENLSLGDFRVADELSVGRLSITGEYHGQSGSGMDFDECRITAASFSGAALPRLRLTDVEIAGTDFSGADLEGASLTRVVFRDCRLSALQLQQSHLRDVAFSGCKIDGANLRMLQAERILFLDSDLREADFYGANLVSGRFFDCDLRAAAFSQAVLPDARFHGSTLDDLEGAEYLRNIVIDSSQVIPLATPVFRALGIRIDDEREPSNGS